MKRELQTGLVVKLFDRSRRPCGLVALPPFLEPPRVIVWESRYFALAVDGEFRETDAFVVVNPLPVTLEDAR